MVPSSNTKSDLKAEKILTAVSRVLARNGYMGTTINAVAKEAGVSRGLLHYYFSSKDEMLARVIKTNMEISIAMIVDVFDQHHTPQGYAKGIVSLLRVIMETDPDFFHLFFEGFAVARQSPVVKEQLTTLYGQFRLALEKGANPGHGAGRNHPCPAPQGFGHNYYRPCGWHGSAIAHRARTLSGSDHLGCPGHKH